MKIILSTLNARYHHASFGLRYLLANLGDLTSETKILEFTIKHNLEKAADEILSHNPQVVGLGVYIWNAVQTLDLVKAIRARNSSVKIVLGGPEVSYEAEEQELCQLADLTIQSEGDFKFREVCEAFLFRGEWPVQKIVRADLPAIGEIKFPYSLYTDEDIQNRTIYVEASRGCPYKCEYCLSSLDERVRNFKLDALLEEFRILIERGARGFKFVDRTFNLSAKISTAILDFFLKYRELDLDLHFEMVPDRLPEEIKHRLQQFRPGQIQLEVGIQTWSTKVSALVSRRQDYAKVCENLRWLKTETHAHLHTDLIAGLPGETLASFAEGFDTLVGLRPHEVQLGILKRLRGAPIARHTQEYALAFDVAPPYQVRSTSLISATEMTAIENMASFWSRIVNSGRFKKTVDVWFDELAAKNESVFWNFWRLSEHLQKHFQRSHSISLFELHREFETWLLQNRFSSLGLTSLNLGNGRRQELHLINHH